ncbi:MULTISPECIES: hypothetical protein [Lactobacillaceae]|uniref:hypothetical protein n=1 Tax=Lactobacillaceae TaxID=33958 RepID=UPI001456C20A|nr:hypothetical protein [Lactobacillus sp. HBUAS51381]NLR08703.1 hypothetical protein [Lactobacillus sp. HBUAS51381]
MVNQRELIIEEMKMLAERSKEASVTDVVAIVELFGKLSREVTNIDRIQHENFKVREEMGSMRRKREDTNWRIAGLSLSILVAVIVSVWFI